MHSDDPDPELLPWMSAGRKPGAYFLPGLRHPVGSLVYGCVFLVAGVAFLAWMLVLASAGAVATGILLCAIFTALGVWMLVIAAIRWGWYRRYVQRNGRRPF